jgi:hypothetical protein
MFFSLFCSWLCVVVMFVLSHFKHIASHIFILYTINHMSRFTEVIEVD